MTIIAYLAYFAVQNPWNNDAMSLSIQSDLYAVG